MFCSNCGVKLPDRSRFCQVCGAPQSAQPQSASTVEILIPEEKKFSVLATGLIITGAVFLIIFVLGIIGYMSDSTTKIPEPSSYGVGDTAKAESYQLTVESANIIESQNMFIQPDNGYEYFEVVMVIENTSAKDLTISSLFDFEAYLDGYTIDQEFFLSGSTSVDSIDGTAAPGKMVRGSLCYELPVDWSELEIQVSVGYGADNERTILISNASSGNQTHTENTLSEYTPEADIETPSYDYSSDDNSERAILLDSIDTEYATYYSVINAVGRALELECDFDELSDKGLSPLLFYGDLWDTGYVFLDLNDDGQDELLIGDMSTPSGSLIALYRMTVNGAVLVVNGGERSHYVLCSDGLIAHLSSDGANSSYETTYRMSKIGLTSAPYGQDKDFFHLTDEFCPEYKSIASSYIG